MGKHQESLKLAIKDELLGKFRAMGGSAGDLLPGTWLYDDFLPSLSRKEEQALEEVLNEMQTEGLIETVSGVRPTYRLTKRGEDILC